MGTQGAVDGSTADRDTFALISEVAPHAETAVPDASSDRLHIVEPQNPHIRLGPGPLVEPSQIRPCPLGVFLAIFRSQLAQLGFGLRDAVHSLQRERVIEASTLVIGLLRERPIE